MTSELQAHQLESLCCILLMFDIICLWCRSGCAFLSDLRTCAAHSCQMTRHAMYTARKIVPFTSGAKAQLSSLPRACVRTQVSEAGDISCHFFLPCSSRISDFKGYTKFQDLLMQKSHCRSIWGSTASEKKVIFFMKMKSYVSVSQQQSAHWIKQYTSMLARSTRRQVPWYWVHNLLSFTACGSLLKIAVL
jgi:hypothetical protein